MSLPEISWDQFRVLNTNPREAFQTLSKRFLCAECGVDSSILNDPETYPGIECEPFYCIDRFVSFQSKYNAKDEVTWAEFKNSLEITIKYKNVNAFQLDAIYCFTNGPPPTPKKNKTGKVRPTKTDELGEMAGEAGIELIWRFGCNILEKLKTSENKRFIRLKRFFFSPTPQPSLIDPRTTFVSTGYAKYHYSACQLSYVHRPELEKDLTNFVNKEDEFLWWTLIGDASIGKSRLILNFCAELSDEWSWGWWTKGSNFDFSKWEPYRPTLIVLDYVMGRLEEIGQLFDTLMSRKSRFIAPVRVLIAERLEEPWLPLLLMRQTTALQILESSFKKSNKDKVVPLKLKAFGASERLENYSILHSYSLLYSKL